MSDSERFEGQYSGHASPNHCSTTEATSPKQRPVQRANTRQRVGEFRSASPLGHTLQHRVFKCSTWRCVALTLVVVVASFLVVAWRTEGQIASWAVTVQPHFSHPLHPMAVPLDSSVRERPSDCGAWTAEHGNSIQWAALGDVFERHADQDILAGLRFDVSSVELRRPIVDHAKLQPETSPTTARLVLECANLCLRWLPTCECGAFVVLPHAKKCFVKSRKALLHGLLVHSGAVLRTMEPEAHGGNAAPTKNGRIGGNFSLQDADAAVRTAFERLAVRYQGAVTYVVQELLRSAAMQTYNAFTTPSAPQLPQQLQLPVEALRWALRPQQKRGEVLSMDVNAQYGYPAGTFARFHQSDVGPTGLTDGPFDLLRVDNPPSIRFCLDLCLQTHLTPNKSEIANATDGTQLRWPNANRTLDKCNAVVVGAPFGFLDLVCYLKRVGAPLSPNTHFTAFRVQTRRRRSLMDALLSPPQPQMSAPGSTKNDSSGSGANTTDEAVWGLVSGQQQDVFRNGEEVPENLIRVPVVVAVLVGPDYVKSRLKPMLLTWLKQMHHVMLFMQRSRKEALRKVVAILNECKRRAPQLNASIYLLDDPRHELRGTTGAWKDLPIIRYLAEELKADRPLFRGVNWICVADDDTMMIPYNLKILLETHYPPVEEALTEYGKPMPFYSGMYVFDSPRKDAKLFIQGGAGIMVNRAAVLSVLDPLPLGSMLANVSRKFGPRIDVWAPNATRPNATIGRTVQRPSIIDRCMLECLQWAGDIRLGCCLRIAGIKTIPEYCFWSGTIFAAFKARKHRESHLFPVSFHNMRTPGLIYDTWNLFRDMFAQRRKKWQALAQLQQTAKDKRGHNALTFYVHEPLWYTAIAEQISARHPYFIKYAGSMPPVL